MRLATIVGFKQARLWTALLALVAVMAFPGRASATVLTYVPSGSTSGSNDLGDLDHHYYYAWTIGLISVPSGETIQSAYITFKNLYNWDSSKNVLYLDLLDKAASGGTVLVNASGTTTPSGPNQDSYNTTVRYASDPDVPAGSSPVTNIADAFDSANALTSGAKTDLTAHSFLPDTGNPLNPSDIATLENTLSTYDSAFNPHTLPASYADNVGQWSVVQNGSGQYDYTYTFTAAQLANLGAYISSDGNRDITLALDPDCHFFNDGVSFTIVTQSLVGGTAVPEPASLMLLGTGLLISANQYRRRRSKKAAK